MTRLISVLVAFAVLFSFTPAVMAQAPQLATAHVGKTDVPPLSPEDVKKLREAAGLIKDALDGKKPASEAPKAEKKEEVQKNMADVADRALSILSSYISSAEQAFKKVAPEVWRIMIRQQYANAVAEPLIPLALIIFITIFAVVTKRWWPEPDKWSDEWWGRCWATSIGPGVLYIGCGIWASIKLTGSIQMLINPEYYAFRNLLQIVINRGGL